MARKAPSGASLARRRNALARRGRAVRARRGRLRPPHLPLRTVGVGQDVRPRHGARAAAARDGAPHRDPRSELRLVRLAETRPTPRPRRARGTRRLRKGSWFAAAARPAASASASAPPSSSRRSRRHCCASTRSPTVRSTQPARHARASAGRTRPRRSRASPRATARPSPRARSATAQPRRHELEASGRDTTPVRCSTTSTPTGRAVSCVDLGSLETAEEQALVAEATLAALWRRRNDRSRC